MRKLLWRSLPALGLALAGLLLSGALTAELLPESFVVYTATDARGSWRGRAPVTMLELSFDPERAAGLELAVGLEPGRFDSGRFIRDANARRALFETSRYPLITFEAGTVEPPDATLPEGSSRDVILHGRLSMHGVTRRLSVPATVTRQGGTLRATGTFTVRLSDYEMTRPSLFGIRVDDGVEVMFDIRASLRGPGDED